MASAPETKLPETDSPDAGSSFIEEFYSPVNLIIIAIISVLVYKIYAKFTRVPAETPAVELPKIRKDMTVAELRQYDGNQADGRVLVAVNGWIFDVTRGRRFYGPGGPYAAFGGKDASRGLATFSVTSSDKEYDDLSDLNSMEMESVKEWEAQFRERLCSEITRKRELGVEWWTKRQFLKLSIKFWKTNSHFGNQQPNMEY